MIEERMTIGTKYPLAGLLTLPDQADDNIPAVVLVHGPGPNDLDEKIEANAPFRDIAEYLSEKGIAVLRYNKRTLTHGTQMVEEDNITVVNETIEDAILAADVLRNDVRIDKNRIFIIGHSLGGVLAPRIDAEGGNFAGLVILAGSLRTLREIIKEQGKNAVAALNGPTKEIAAKQVAALGSELDSIDSMSDEEAKKTYVVGRTRAYYFKEMEAHPAEAYLRDIDKPVLIAHGGKDFQVFVNKDFACYKKLLGDRPNVAFKLYPKLNHLFIESTTGTYDEYKNPGRVDTTVLDDVVEWILSK